MEEFTEVHFLWIHKTVDQEYLSHFEVGVFWRAFTLAVTDIELHINEETLRDYIPQELFQYIYIKTDANLLGRLISLIKTNIGTRKLVEHVRSKEEVDHIEKTLGRFLLLHKNYKLPNHKHCMVILKRSDNNKK